MATEDNQNNQKQCTCKHNISSDDYESIEMLEHIASCETCAEAFIEQIEKKSYVKAPHYMKADIMQKALKIKEEQEPKHISIKLPSVKFRLFAYSMKVGLAMCGALILLFTSFGNDLSMNLSHKNANETQYEDRNKVDSITNKMSYGLREFSNNMAHYADWLVSDNNKNVEENNND